jgi:aminoglycoside phosphotransferase
VNAAMAFLAQHWDRLALHEFGSPADFASVLITPRFQTSAHVVYLILSKHSAEPVLVIKAARRAAEANNALTREAFNLKAVHASRPGGFDSIPRLITFEEYAGTPILLETAVSGRVLKSSDVRRRPREYAQAVFEWVATLHAASAHRSARPTIAGRNSWTEPLDRVVRDHSLSAEDTELVARTRDMMSPLAGNSFPLVFEHGDLSAPNILVTDDGRLNVVDWELAEPAGLPGQDLFFSLAFVAFARAGASRPSEYLDAFANAFFGSRAWAWPYVGRYSDRLGVDPDLLPALFVACWSTYVARRVERLAVSCSAGEGPEERWSRIKRNHYFALWRHAVRHIDEIASPPRHSPVSIPLASGIGATSHAR